jgi:MFS transporter, PPP family, 3-phenylpropionic acid transporter
METALTQSRGIDDVMSPESAGHLRARGRGDLLPFILLYATLYAGFGVLSPFLPTLLQARGLSPDQIGLVLALSTAVRLVSGPLAGRIADLYGALRAVFACSAVSAAFIAFGYLRAHAFWSVLAVSVICAAMLAPLTTIADALALAAAGPLGKAKRRFEYGWVRGAGSAAFILGSVLAGQAIIAVDLDVIIWCGSAFLAAAAAAVAVVPTSRPPSIAPTSLGGSPSIRALLRLQEFRLLLIIAALVLGSHAMHDSFAMIRWKAAGILPPTASLLWSESIGAEVLVFVVIGPRLLDRIGPTRAMTVAAAAGVLRWTVMAIQGAGVDRTRLAQALPPLLDTADELKAVASDLGAPVADIHLGTDATETAVKRLPLENYRVVYFATHGLVAGDVKGLGEPSLALTLPTKPSELDDGLLTASEVAQLKLNADWVVLSACNTAAGDKPGAEALSGLARAFFYAGRGRRWCHTGQWRRTRRPGSRHRRSI